MLTEILSLDKYDKLKELIPENEQGIIFTFKKVPEKVQQKINTDRTIQVIDEEGVKLWVSITPIIPARKQSIAHLHFDPKTRLEDELVKVEFTDYEKGTANVTLIPSMHKITVLASSLEEIELGDRSYQEFNTFSSNYYDFLKKLAELSESDHFFESILYSNIKKDNRIKNSWIINMEDYTIRLNPNASRVRDMFRCTCPRFVNASGPVIFCKYIVSALNHICKSKLYYNETWESNENYLWALLHKFKTLNDLE